MVAKKHTKQSNQIAISKRLAELEKLMLCNYSRSELCKWYDQEYGLSPSMCDQDSRKVREFWKQVFESEREFRVYENIKHLEKLYKLALNEDSNLGAPSLSGIRLAYEIRLSIAEIDQSYSPRAKRYDQDHVNNLLEVIAKQQEELDTQDTVVCIE